MSPATKTAMRADKLVEATERAREASSAARSRPGMPHTPAIAHGTPPAVRRADAPAVANVVLTRLRAHHRNVRTDLGDLRELTESIRTQGVLVPLMAERRGDMLQILHPTTAARSSCLVRQW